MATGAKLYSVGHNATTKFMESAALRTQFIAQQNGGDIRATNMSFGVTLGTGVFDGNSLLSQFVDWSASEHDILYVVAGNQGNMSPIPKDNFNGMTIARSAKVGNVFRQVSTGNTYNEDAAGDRTSIDLIAPGDGILLASQNNMNVTLNGTSFAAPHVTGTVALLQEYGDDRVADYAANPANAPNWGGTAFSGPTPRRHEVMKAVLLNSADKFKGILGMDRTVLKSNGTDNWFDSNAATDSSIPLDLEMGAGHLNAKRALDQFSPGEFDTIGGTASIPLVGWDYGYTFDNFDIQKYVFNSPLQANDYISATLSWDRDVFLDFDTVPHGEYNIGDDFLYHNPENLDLYLLPAGSTNINQAVATSNSSEMNLEHFLFQIPTAGSYEIWVKGNGLGFGVGDDFALAWWAGETVFNGDFDGDGLIDQEDYNLWASTFGQSVTPGSGADANNNGLIDAADYTVWRDAFAAVAVSVPEPSSLLLVMLTAITCGLSARGNRLAA